MKTKVCVSVAMLFLVSLMPLRVVGSPPKKDTVVLTADNVLVLDSQVDGDSVSKLILEAKALDARLSQSMSEKMGKPRAIYLFLNTPGGSIQNGLELMEALNGLGRPIHTVTLFAASMGFQLAQNLGDRLILQNGVLMSHRAAGQFNGEFGGMAPSQADNRFEFWKSRVEDLDRKTVERTQGKQTLESYQKLYASETWLSGARSVEMGFADQVVRVKCDPSLTGVEHRNAVMAIFRVTYDIDKCPINTSPMNVKISFQTTNGKYMDSDTFFAEGGTFGLSCLTNFVPNSTLCATDSTLDFSKLEALKGSFKGSFENKRSKVIQSL